MTLNSKFTLAIRKFLKKYGKIIFLVLIVWLLIILVNTYLKNRPKELKASNTYSPDKPVIDYGGEVPKKEKESVNETLDNFLTFCKNKDYQSAYDMLTTDCKEFLYDNKLENFQSYVDSIFSTYNNYSYNQNYSNVNGTYIYDVTILNSDILSTGTTGGYNKYKEKVSVLEENGIKKISNQGYMGNEEVGIEAEDDYMKVKIISKDSSYDKVGYNVEIINKTDRTIIISDNKAGKEVTLNVGGDIQTATNLMIMTGVIKPGETVGVQYIFDRFYDDTSKDTQLSFNYVRIMQNYDSNMTLDNQEQQAEKLYSFNIDF